MFTEILTRLRELREELLCAQTKESDPQIKSNIDEVIMQIEQLMLSLSLLKNIIMNEHSIYK